ncbi:sensor domain-containing diguanylate cyclase [Treponema denticola]|jgi:diguanylate cyclase (GGDEF) domain protein|uniref:diguanylate cyclase n=3 Tax=Treponema denticola TaxID=158 RepID=M2BA96_TREDN|nr:diguanylate cyclase DgcA [Treponema denticola]EMB32232.1 diguanylate cyclase (GGDEF) domain-containing protein [Treponema denticola MYR-T]EMB32641.1 diguanylate cyclase (GGDEF) domain-containing protein [Treponema denticola H1-T]EMB33194.1 diguanylate cyclase (GGDEF) domain-containing protein [Treponema denticola H-22]EMB44995.1 diguanylate cyclase (GGDEF) domain-containing protein [Treponema denticola AL-2]EMB21527.1 diguanylate cyclase (GGDEF) domain-containing protein [Treponema denticol
MKRLVKIMKTTPNEKLLKKALHSCNNKKYADKILHQEKEIFDLKQLLQISKSLNSVLEFDRLIEAILYIVMAQLKTLGAAIFTKKSFDDNLFVLNRDHYGFDIIRDAQYSINVDHPLINFLDKSDSGCTPDEISKNIKTDKIVKDLFSLSPSFFVPLKAKNRMIGFLLLGEKMESSHQFTDYEKNIIENIASLAAIAINNSQLLEMTTTDIMTHLKLKHYFFTLLMEHLYTINSSGEKKETLSILMIDIDFFKNINDTYGHAAGDIVLEEVAKIIKSCTRNADTAARYGGEEFVVMLNNTSASAAMAVAERIRKSVEEKSIMYDGKKINVTISIGVSSYNFDLESAKSIVERADKALYESKQNGRNRVTLSKNNLPKA